MHKDKLLSMLGLARRAGKLSMGHDMAEKAIKSRKAKMVIFCADASPRLYSEFERTVEHSGSSAQLYKTDITMNEIHFAVGYKAGVMTLDDENFSVKVTQLLKEE